VSGFINDKFDRHAGDGQRVAQGNQVAGFFGSLNARNARNAQHVAFLGVATLDQGQRRWQHDDAPRGDAYAFGVGFVSHIHHVGEALCVKVCECGHAFVCKGLT
jgi:hypothetical protein